MRRAILALVVGLLAGCSLLPPPAGMQVTIPAMPEVSALPVTIVDHAGIVREAAPGEGPNDISTTTIRAVPGRDDAVMLTWMGRDCVDRAIVTIDPIADRYRVTVDEQSSASSCSAVGILRTLVLQLTEPVGADAFGTS